VTIILTFKDGKTPFDKDLALEGKGQISREVQTALSPGLKEPICHYGVVVRDKDKKVILQDTHCPEIIIE
jgi:hypothetical protein